MSKQKHEEIVRDHLFLPDDQNSYLMDNLQLEEVIASKLRSGPLLDLKNLIVKSEKNKRWADRPLLRTVSKLDEAVRDLRALGLSTGLIYPAVPPSKAIFGPTEFDDFLAYETADPFPLPALPDFFEGLKDLSDRDKETLGNNIKLYKFARQG